MQSYTLAPETIRELAQLPGSTTIPLRSRGAILVSVGASADSVYVIEAGVLKLERSPERNPLIVQIVGRGAIVGGETLAAEIVYRATATVMEPGSALAIPTGSFLEWCDRHCHVVF